MKKLIYKWLGLEVFDDLALKQELIITKVREHDTDLARIMNEQLDLREQYPLVDKIIVPTTEQVAEMNKGEVKNEKNIQSNPKPRRKNTSKHGKGSKR